MELATLDAFLPADTLLPQDSSLPAELWREVYHCLWQHRMQPVLRSVRCYVDTAEPGAGWLISVPPCRENGGFRRIFHSTNPVMWGLHVPSLHLWVVQGHGHWLDRSWVHVRMFRNYRARRDEQGARQSFNQQEELIHCKGCACRSSVRHLADLPLRARFGLLPPEPKTGGGIVPPYGQPYGQV